MGSQKNIVRAPVLFLICRRPRHTRAAFEAIRKAKPPRLYVAADGPRPHMPKDAELCRDARRVIEGVDWPCSVHTLFRDTNLTGPVGTPQALDWFFGQEESGIILEDDVVAHPDFFGFCESLLEKYCDEPRIMHIGGYNAQMGLKHGGGSYYFSKNVNPWGWASWARAWAAFEPQVPAEGVELFIHDTLRAMLPEGPLMSLPDLLRSCIGTRKGPWDARWWYFVRARGALAAVSNYCLTRNIGFDKEGNSLRDDRIIQSMPLSPIGQMTHPEHITWNQYADLIYYRICYHRLADTREGLLKELRLRVAHGDPAESIEYLEKVGRKYFTDQGLA